MNYDFSNITNLIAQQGTRNPQPDPMKNFIAGMGMGMKREELGLQKERLGFEREELGMRKEEWGTRKGFIEAQTQQLYAELNDRDFKNMKGALEFFATYGDMISYENVDEIGSMLKKKTKGALQLPTREQINEVATQLGISPQIAFKFLHWKTMGGVKNVYSNLNTDIGKLIQDKQTLAGQRDRLLSMGLDENDPEVKQLDENIKIIDATIAVKNEGKKEGRPQFLKLLDEYNSLPKGDPNKEFILAKIKKETESRGMKVQVDKEGNVSVVEGPMGEIGAGGAMTKPTQTEVEKKLIGSGEALGRLSQIEKLYKPEFQTLSTRWDALKTSWKEKLGMDVSEKDKALLADYSEYKRRSIHNLNLYIKDITGAQLTVQEAARLTKGMPNPGMGFFDGDSPTEYESKLKGIMTELRMASARYNYIKKYGLTMESVSLSEMPSIINKRGKALERELKNIYSGNELTNAVKARLAEEFGLSTGR